MTAETLKKSWQFRACYRGGEKIVSRYAIVFYYKAESDGLKIGVVASKRVGNAVQRNRAKRLLRTAARHVAHKLNDPKLWVVLVARAPITEQTSTEVTAVIEQALTERGLVAGAT